MQQNTVLLHWYLVQQVYTSERNKTMQNAQYLSILILRHKILRKVTYFSELQPLHKSASLRHVLQQKVGSHICITVWNFTLTSAP